MTAAQEEFGPWSSIKPFLGQPPTWYPESERDRIAAYWKYDEIYWNDPKSYKIRVLDEEEPLYIPNARTIVDTTAHYLLKGLKVQVDDPEKNKVFNDFLEDFLKREMFYARLSIAKRAGVARGDWVFHLTADPLKPAGSRVSLNPVHPSMVIQVPDDDDIDKIVRVHLVDQFIDKEDPKKIKVRKLTYEYVVVGGRRRVQRHQALYEIDSEWWGPRPKLFREEIPQSLLPEQITTIPLYFFPNLAWDGDLYGSSEIRGLVPLVQGVSQAATDQQMSLALEGLGVYATDGGRPVDGEGNDVDWEVAPGKVMEVSSGSYFRRVEGLSTLKPSMDHINYVESKLREATGLSDVALGRVDVQTAESGIALAIKFLPTLAKLDDRDTYGVGKLTQLFFDLKGWFGAYENSFFDADVHVTLGAKLPEDDVATVNELNNMIDRNIISRQYYRERMKHLGHEFPDDIEAQIEAERKKDAEIAALAAPLGLQDNAEAAAKGEKPIPPASAGGRQNAPRNPGGNKSNNKNKPNESRGTEAK